MANSTGYVSAKLIIGVYFDVARILSDVRANPHYRRRSDEGIALATAAKLDLSFFGEATRDLEDFFLLIFNFR